MAEFNNSLGNIGSGSIFQNNIGYIITVEYNVALKTNSILTRIRQSLNLISFTISEIQTPIIILGLGMEGSVIKETSKLIFKPGKGTYGLGGIPITNNDLFLINTVSPSVSDFENDSTLTYNLGDITGSNISEYINNYSPSLYFQSISDGGTLIKVINNGITETYLFLGITGNYGLGQTLTSIMDYQLIPEETPSSLQDLQSVLNEGNLSSIPIQLRNTPLLLDNGTNPIGYILASGNELIIQANNKVNFSTPNVSIDSTLFEIGSNEINLGITPDIDNTVTKGLARQSSGRIVEYDLSSLQDLQSVTDINPVTTNSIAIIGDLEKVVTVSKLDGSNSASIELEENGLPRLQLKVENSTYQLQANNLNQNILRSVSSQTGFEVVSINGIQADNSGNILLSTTGITNLTYTPSSTQGIINSDTGTDAIIPLANGINAGISIENYTANEKIKLAGIELQANRLLLGESSTTAYRGDRGKTSYDHSQIILGNPHGTTKSDIGLGNVDNTSDINKPVSTAQSTALSLKANIDSQIFTGIPSLPTGTIGITQNQGTNNNSLATTAFVQQNRLRGFSFMQPALSVASAANNPFYTKGLVQNFILSNATGITTATALNTINSGYFMITPYKCKITDISMNLNTGGSSANPMEVSIWQCDDNNNTNPIQIFNSSNSGSQLMNSSNITISNIIPANKVLRIAIRTGLTTTATNFGFINLFFEEQF